MELTITDYYRIGRDAVRFFPLKDPSKPCVQPQAFRVLQRDPRGSLEVGTDTLGVIPTDKNTPFFWSRKWQQNRNDPNKLGYNYPLFTMFELSNDVDGTIFKSRAARTYFLELAVLDVFNPAPAKPIGCEARPINQIFLDTELMLDSILKYFGGMVTATTSVDSVEKVYYKPFLEEAKIQGDISGYTQMFDIGTFLQGQNKNVSFDRVEYSPARNIFGTKCRIRIKVANCQTADYEYGEENYLPVIGFEAGCKDC